MWIAAELLNRLRAGLKSALKKLRRNTSVMQVVQHRLRAGMSMLDDDTFHWV
jgi:5-methylcytosine-specific restriction endonuclease McrBC regulatory subunit McrC